MSEAEKVLLDAASWHESQAAKVRRRMTELQRWAHENGEPNGGRWHVVVAPIERDLHDKSARHFRRQLAKLRRRAPTPTPEVPDA